MSRAFCTNYRITKASRPTAICLINSSQLTAPTATNRTAQNPTVIAKTTMRACNKSNTILVAPVFPSSQADKDSPFVRLTKSDSRTNSYFCIFMKKSRRLNHIIALLCFMLLSYHTFKQNSRICFILFGFYSKFYQIFIKVRFFMVSAPTFRPKKQQKMFHMKPSKVFRCFT